MIVGDADDGPANVMAGEGATNGAAPGAYSSFDENELPDFDAEPVENFEAAKPTTVTSDDLTTTADDPAAAGAAAAGTEGSDSVSAAAAASSGADDMD